MAKVLAVSAHSTGNRPVTLTSPAAAANTVVWTASGAAGTTYAAFVKRAQVATTAAATYAELGLPAGTKSCVVRDLWAGEVVAPAVAGAVTWAQPGGAGYDGGIFSLTQCH